MQSHGSRERLRTAYVNAARTPTKLGRLVHTHTITVIFNKLAFALTYALRNLFINGYCSSLTVFSFHHVRVWLLIDIRSICTHVNGPSTFGCRRAAAGTTSCLYMHVDPWQAWLSVVLEAYLRCFLAIVECIGQMCVDVQISYCHG